jgi:hypothetical protein
VFKNPKKLSLTSLFDDGNLFLAVSAGYSNVPVVKTVIIEDEFDCKNKTYSVIRQRAFDESGTYVGLENFSLSIIKSEKVETERFNELLLTACNSTQENK